MRILHLIITLSLFFLVFACEPENDFSFSSDRYGPAEASEQVLIEEGPFSMGSDYSAGIDLFTGEIDEPFFDEHPKHIVNLNSYYIDRTEVSNKQYRACVYAGACDDPMSRLSVNSSEYYTDSNYNDFPVVNVTWKMAGDYCAWRDMRLPTEAEWEKAARGVEDDRTYPWGWLSPTCQMANISIPGEQPTNDDQKKLVETCYGFPTPVGAYIYSESPFGALNMTGNVAEWVADYYADDYYDSAIWPDNDNNPTGPTEGDRRIVRGGCFSSTATLARVSYREHRSEKHYDSAIGFRCVKDAE